MGINKPAIRRLARPGGVKRITKPAIRRLARPAPKAPKVACKAGKKATPKKVAKKTGKKAAPKKSAKKSA